MAFLKVIGQGEERTVFLADAPLVLGRGEDTDVLLTDLKVSRRHCAIEPCGPARWRVRDLGSGNGTKVNG
ncbi:MAG: FHA domain-containing protein, partial [Planctomycetota bacterium]